MKSTHFKWKMIMIHTDRTLKLYFKKKKTKQKENKIVQTPNSKYTNCDCSAEAQVANLRRAHVEIQIGCTNGFRFGQFLE